MSWGFGVLGQDDELGIHNRYVLLGNKQYADFEIGYY